MNPVWIVGNAISIVGAMITMAYLTHVLRTSPRFGPPWLAIAVVGVTAATTSLQYIVPGLLDALRRDPDGLAAGEIWRLVTPLLVQPRGIGQIIPNAIFLIVFLPLVERLYGAGVLAVYVLAGIVGQAVNSVWDPTGGGASTAAFGLMGALFAYVLRNRRQAPWPLVALAFAALTAGVVLSLARDGHGPGLLSGALVGALMPHRIRPPSLQAQPGAVTAAAKID